MNNNVCSLQTVIDEIRGLMKISTYVKGLVIFCRNMQTKRNLLFRMIYFNFSCCGEYCFYLIL